jgi:hypothetical protein
MAQEQLDKKPIVEQCKGCENVEGDVCRIWVSPAAKWRMGVCPSATHVKVDVKSREEKVRVGQQKQKKAK